MDNRQSMQFKMSMHVGEMSMALRSFEHKNKEMRRVATAAVGIPLTTTPLPRPDNSQFLCMVGWSMVMADYSP